MREISLDVIDEKLTDKIEPYLDVGISPMFIVVRSFFRGEEWVDYLTFILDIDDIKKDFNMLLEKYFHVIY